MLSFGIMQGRLTPPKGRGIQFFPFENWKREFEISAKIGLNEIEWIFDYENYKENPLWTKEGVKALKGMIAETGVRVRSVCFDYFMRRPFFKTEDPSLEKENLEFVKRNLDAMDKINASLIEIPMVDDSSVKEDEKKRVIDFLHKMLDLARPMHVMVGCETDMPVGVFRSFLEQVDDRNIYANYDSGNSSGLGYDHEKEILSLSDFIANVHVKDRVLHGTTVALGSGSADFDKVFSSLKKIGYSKSIILQAARDVDGDEENNIRKQMGFVKNYCLKYGLE